MLKYFTEKLYNKSIAINPRHVVRVIDNPSGVTIALTTSDYFDVTEDFLTVIARLNERD